MNSCPTKLHKRYDNRSILPIFIGQTTRKTSLLSRSAAPKQSFCKPQMPRKAMQPQPFCKILCRCEGENRTLLNCKPPVVFRKVPVRNS